MPDAVFYVQMTRTDPDWERTSIGFDLLEETNGVRLSFSHAGWRECNSNFRVASFCWAMLLKGLKDYMEKGIILPFEERS
jgi:hypothetical protein